MLFDQINKLLGDACPPETLERDRIVFWLYYRQGYTAGEIAGLPAVALTVKGVESLLYRLTAALRAQLNPPGEKGFGDPPRPSK
jgi:RNA polymerase sigma-70 factor, ECF subfamily